MNTISDAKKINILKKFQEDNIEAVNEARRFFRKNSVSFFHNISFVSGGLISLSARFLTEIYKIGGYNINQYKILYILAILSLAFSLVLGLLYKNIYSEWIAVSANNEMLKKLEEVFGKQGSEYKKDYQREKCRWTVSRIINFLCPAFFVIGILLTFLYFSAQIFDFDMGCLNSLLEIVR